MTKKDGARSRGDKPTNPPLLTTPLKIFIQQKSASERVFCFSAESAHAATTHNFILKTDCGEIKQLALECVCASGERTANTLTQKKRTA